MRGFVVYKTMPINIQDEAAMLMRNPRATWMTRTALSGDETLDCLTV
jgi:hypothetical protein